MEYLFYPEYVTYRLPIDVFKKDVLASFENYATNNADRYVGNNCFWQELEIYLFNVYSYRNIEKKWGKKLRAEININFHSFDVIPLHFKNNSSETANGLSLTFANASYTFIRGHSSTIRDAS